MELTQMPEHEKIFNEICNKLSELSQVEETKSSKDRVAQLEKQYKKQGINIYNGNPYYCSSLCFN